MGLRQSAALGDRCQKVDLRTSIGEAKKADSDWKREKDDYDDTDGALCTDSIDNHHSQDVKEDTKKERDLFNRPDRYKTMG